MEKKIYEPPKWELLFMEDNLIRTSFEDDSEIDGDLEYGDDDNWNEFA